MLASRPRSLQLAAGLLVLGISTTSAAKYRNFNLPCLAPLLQQVDSEAPKSLNVAFLRGPWRAPSIRENIGVVNFPITTKSKEAQRWFNQGVALIHGQANAEAERSFRQALLLEPENPMIFWGLSLANEQRPGRARLFAQSAIRRIGNATTDRERKWITVLGNFYALERNTPVQLPFSQNLSEKESFARHRQRIRDFETIALAHPDEFEASTTSRERRSC